MAKKTPIEDQYQLYLKRICLTEKMMHHKQRIQLRQTFFGAWGQLLLEIQEGDALSEDNFEQYINDMTEELKAFWLKEKTRMN